MIRFALKIAKWGFITLSCLIIAFLFVVAKSVQEWEEPCSARSTPMVPYPCGGERT